MISYDDWYMSHERDEDRPCVECHDDGPTYTSRLDPRPRCETCLDNEETYTQRAADEVAASTDLNPSAQEIA